MEPNKNFNEKCTAPKKSSFTVFRDRTTNGAGIIFYDNTGIWVISETRGNHDELIDMGGKYGYEDGNILITACREFSEETYYSFNFTYFMLLKLINENKVIFIQPASNLRSSSYLTLMININDVNFNMDVDCFERNRDKFRRDNPTYKFYTSNKIIKLLFDELSENKELMNYRLKTVINRTIEFQKISSKFVVLRHSSKNV